MTRADAIKELKEMRTDAWTDSRQMEALSMGIKALEQEPTKEERALLQKWRDNRGISIEDFEDAMNALQEPSGETVSIEAFKQVMWERDIAIEQLKELGYDFGQKIEPKTGHWVVGRIFPTKVSDENLIEYRCSVCDRAIRCSESQLVNYPYCHCGARMFEPQESEETDADSN